MRSFHTGLRRLAVRGAEFQGGDVREPGFIPIALKQVDVIGVHLMRRRRPGIKRDRDLTNGPGKLCAALGIDDRHNGVPLDGPMLSIHAAAPIPDSRIVVTPRIGITRAAQWPLRWFIRDNPYVSRTPSHFPLLEVKDR